MATWKKVSKKSKRTAHRIGKRAPWVKSKMAQGTVTVTISLEHVFASLAAIGKRLKDPKAKAMLREIFAQAIAEEAKDQRFKKKKPARDPNLN
jgi:DNA-binding protein YbaB